MVRDHGFGEGRWPVMDAVEEAALRLRKGDGMRIVVLDDDSLQMGRGSPWKGLEGMGEVVAYGSTPADLVEERAREADVLVTNKAVLDAGLIGRLLRLKCIAVTAAGTNVVDGAAARRRGIPVCNTPAYGTDAVAQHVFALLLELCRRTALHDASIRDGEWARRGTFCYWLTPQMELTGRTLGVFGYGSLGRRVAEIGHAFGMDVVACSHHPQPAPDFAPFAFADRDELFRRADVVSLHCPLTEETRGVVCARTLALMKPGGIVINTSRGPVCNSADVADALRSGHLAAFGADVLEKEPPSADDPLLSAPNTLITPHLAWSTNGARQNIIDITVENIRCFAAGRPQNVVNP